MDKASEFDAEDTPGPSGWIGDALDRKQYADFLTVYLASKFDRSGPGGGKSFTLALDAWWGEGKTFFVEHWARDLRSGTKPHPVVLFDAWSADYASDPVLAFMSSFKKAIDKQIEEAGIVPEIREKARRSVNAAVGLLRKALIPAGKIVAKGLLAKYGGVAIDELGALYRDWSDSDGDEAATSTAEAKGDAEKPKEKVDEKGLDKAFEEILKAETERGALIEQFRARVSQSLAALEESGRLSAPMFVFVDELDRCRPDFAIALLEGLKHIFGIDGVCFVVSVNMAQMSESVKAVYGAGFEGFGYLERFFDMRYALPRPTGAEHSAALLGLAEALNGYQLELGLPVQGFMSTPAPNQAGAAIGWVYESLDMNLRSQRKSFEMALACASSIGKSKKIHILWLTFLCALRQTSPQAFDALASAGTLDRARFRAVVDQHLVSDVTRLVVDPSTGNYLKGKPPKAETVRLVDVLWEYYHAARRELTEVREELRSPNVARYPDAVTDAIANELPPQRELGKPYFSSLAGYYKLVQTAGHLSE